MTTYSAPMINKVMIVGNVVCAPQVNFTKGNKIKVANFRIACGRKFRTKEELKEEYCYISVTAWLNLATLCEQNLVKGDKVYIEGSLQNRQIKDSELSIVEIRADKIQILTSKKVFIREEGFELEENKDDRSDFKSEE